jgi:hypothetical protein
LTQTLARAKKRIKQIFREAATVSGVIALAKPRRIKASHRRRRRVASDHLLYILNNPLSGTDPTGYQSRGSICAIGTSGNANGCTSGAGSDIPTGKGDKIDDGKKKPAREGGNGGQTSQGTTGPGKRDSETPGPDKKATEPKTDPNQPSAPTTDGSSNLTRFLGGLKVVGGVAECSAGATLCSTGVGCAATVLICGHAADTMSSGAHEAWYGVPQQSLTSRGLQAAGLSRDQADFGDAVIGLANVGAAGAKATGAVATIRGASFNLPTINSSTYLVRLLVIPTMRRGQISWHWS